MGVEGDVHTRVGSPERSCKIHVMGKKKMHEFPKIFEKVTEREGEIGRDS